MQSNDAPNGLHEQLEVVRLPDMEQILGATVDAEGFVHLRYRSTQQTVCQLRLALDDALVLEEIYIRIRQAAAAKARSSSRE